MRQIPIVELVRRHKALAALNKDRVLMVPLIAEAFGGRKRRGAAHIRAALLRSKTEALVKHDRIFDGHPRRRIPRLYWLLRHASPSDLVPFWIDLPYSE